MEKPGRTIGAILGGGRSTRFGSPKGLAEVAGRSLIERVVAAHREVFGAVLLVTDSPEIYPPLPIATTPDRFHRMGPVAGIHAALAWAVEHGYDGACCTPVDAPFIRAELFRLLLDRSSGADAVLPLSAGPLGFEPLFGWYSTRVLTDFVRFLDTGGGALHTLVSRLGVVRHLPLEAVQPIGGAERVFLNVNTRDDLTRARRLEGTRCDP